MPEQQRLERQIMQYGFAAYDLALFLDNNPRNKKALKLYNQFSNKQKELTAEYERLYGPTSQQANMSEDVWQWADGPWPWDTTNMKG